MKHAAAFRALSLIAVAATLSACSSMPKMSMPDIALPQWASLKASTVPPPVNPSQEPLAQVRERPEMLMAALDNGLLITFNAGTPERLIHQLQVQGLLEGEQLTNLDFDAHRPALYALTNLGRVLLIDPETGQSRAGGPVLKAAATGHWSMDVDAKGQSLRLVSDEGAYWRLPLDTQTGLGKDAQLGPNLRYAPGDLLQGLKPRIVAVAYSPATEKEPGMALAIDGGTAFLVQQGRTLTATTDDLLVDEHQLNAIGPLGISRFDTAAMDIADNSRAAYVLTMRDGVNEAKLYELTLNSGQARFIGIVPSPRKVLAMTIVP